ncbi:MAG TPA: hypothetical protein VMZ27_02995, partial [Candidatus Saccharimonadales bacterium]|nr:hypothetical protein [Candidatus Saccharimonadales bacterium]
MILYGKLLAAAILLLALLPWAHAAAPYDFSSPAGDPADLSFWPNQTSRANSDSWLAEHHDSIRKMQPRVLVLNFHNRSPRAKLDKLVGDLIAALGEGSRYHGYADSNAPAFLQYKVFKFVDLREPESTNANSSKVPFKSGKTSGFKLDYNAFFSEEFAREYGIKDPTQLNRFLRLDELVDGGYVHELWFLADQVKAFGAYEVVEEKPLYDATFHRIGNRFVQAGNGGDDEQKWTGRSLRIGFINVTRGIGCFMESLSHGMEGNSTSKAVPYFTKYFSEYAGYDVHERWGVPFYTFYAVPYSGKPLSYPTSDTAVIQWRGKEITVTNYFVIGGNAHWPPNARGHYDLDNTVPVLSTIEDWRIGSGPDGRDLRKPFTNEAFARYRKLAPDCMGAWLVYWRQNMPGLDNRQKDDSGKP